MTIVTLIRKKTKSIVRFEWNKDLSLMNDEDYNRECQAIIDYARQFYFGWLVHSPTKLRKQ